MNKFYIHVPELKDKLAVLAKFQMMGVKWSDGGEEALGFIPEKRDSLSYGTYSVKEIYMSTKNENIQEEEPEIKIKDFLQCETIDDAIKLVEPKKETWYKHVYWRLEDSNTWIETSIVTTEKWEIIFNRFPDKFKPIKVDQITEWEE